MCKEKMCKIYINLLCIILAAKGDRWYSATIIERKDAAPRNSTNPNFRTNYIQDNEHQYLPLMLMEPKLHNGHGFTPIVSPFVNAMPQENSTSTYNSKRDLVLEYNTTVNNINVWRKARPKRKHIRKRCPTRPRQSKKMKTRFLEVFEVVEFDHVPCTTSSGLEGTCLPEAECVTSGGSTMGSCADGYGTCCVTQFQCDDQSAASSGWFTNPDFPSPSTEKLTCAFTLDKSSEDIKQIRLDFVSFELLPPTDGVCQDDQFVVSGQNVNSVIPILCGINTGQHVYIEVGDQDGPISLTFQTASSDSRLFSIKVTQLTASDELAAPSGCLQYFTDTQGYLESFNYRDKSEIGIARAQSYFNNLNYAMCIGRAPQTCTITYTNDGNMQIVNYDTDGLLLIPPDQAGVETLNCPGDWLLMAAIRLCGERLNDGSVFQDFTIDAPVTDNNAGPIVVWFRTDESYVGYGFRIKYQQNTCNT